MEVTCSIDYCELENDDGRAIDSVSVTCSRCDHETQSYGDSSASVRRCLLLMRDECPRGERNWYIADGGEDED
jgi:hypothetical protein